jgi:small subunit ribosomal protein S8
MVSTDPIADMLTRIRNAIAVHKNEVVLPHSIVKEAIASVLVKEGVLDAIDVLADKQKQLKITINKAGTNPDITEISRLSKPGRRLYVGADDIPSVKQGRGFVIISTSQGMLTGEEAKSKRLGGELICKVY